MYFRTSWVLACVLDLIKFYYICFTMKYIQLQKFAFICVCVSRNMSVPVCVCITSITCSEECKLCSHVMMLACVVVLPLFHGMSADFINFFFFIFFGSSFTSFYANFLFHLLYCLVLFYFLFRFTPICFCISCYSKHDTVNLYILVLSRHTK